MIDGLRRAWRLLPAEYRVRLAGRIVRLMAPRAAPGIGAGVPGAVSVAGLLGSATGIGEGARLCFDALRRLGYPVDGCDLTAALGGAARLDGVDGLGIPAARPGGGTMILHLNAPQTARALMLMGRRLTTGRRVIGYWAWELPAIPPDWLSGFDHVHEVWTPSRFVADAVRPFTTMPVRVVPHPVARPRPSRLSRADLGVPEDAFVVLTMFHLGSGFVRKNPVAAVEAFRRAFGDRTDVCLVVKAVADASLPWAECALEQAVAGAPNIRVLRKVLSAPDQAALIARSDVVLSLHRAEGFGLVLAEAMLLGRPVVATGWSGNLEFMSADSAALVGVRMVPVEDPQGAYVQTDQLWADPDVEEAAEWLRRLAAGHELRDRLGRAAEQEAERRLGLVSYAAAVGPALPPLAAPARQAQPV